MPSFRLTEALEQGARAATEAFRGRHEVWVATGKDEPETVRAGRRTPAQSAAPQAFTFKRMLSNHGSGEYTSLAEFALLGG